MRLSRILSAAVLSASVSCAVPSIQAADIYVATTGSDGNAGTITAPVKTITRASTLARPGDVVKVRAGTYNECVVTRASGRKAAKVRYTALVKWAPKIVSNCSIAWLNYGSWVQIDGFDVSGTGQNGILDKGSNGRILRNHVHDIAASACDGNGGSGINAGEYFAVNTYIEENVVHDIGAFDSGPCSTVHGIYHSHTGGTIKNNIVYRTVGWGIHLWHAPYRIDIVNNLSFNNGRGGLVMAGADGPYYGEQPADYIRVINNIFMDNPTAVQENTASGQNNIYVNNLIWNNGRGFVLAGGKAASGTISLDPQLVNYQKDGGGDYHLSSTSPAIDRGSTVAMPSRDIDNEARPSGALPDIGPDELMHQ